LFMVGATLRGRSSIAEDHRHATNPASEAGFSLLSFLYVMLPSILAICLRIYPFLLSGLPFSVDAWPSIKYAEVLLEKSPISLNSEELRGCDELGDRLFGAAVSALTGLRPMTAMAFYLPLVGATSILILYALVKGIYGETAAFMASMLLATAIPDTILTAGVKGETYAHPLYMTLLLLFLHKHVGFWRKMLLFSLVSASLALTHYYTGILIAVAMTSMGMALLILGWRAGRGIRARILVFPITLATSVLVYLVAYARWALEFISKIDWLSAASYQLIFFSLTLYSMLKPRSSSHMRTAALSIIASLAALTLAFLSTKRPLVPGAPTLPMHYLLYASPFLAAASLAVLGHEKAKSLDDDERALLPQFWLVTIIALECYAVFGNVEAGLGLTLAYRGLVFLIPPLSILCAIGFVSLLECKVAKLQGLSKILAAAILTAILAVNLYAFYATIFMQERYMGYFWLYEPPEYRAGLWTSSACDELTIACDVKFTYLLKYYFDLRVNEVQGYLYLAGKAPSRPTALLMYEQMYRNGYVIYGGYSINLPESSAEKLRELNHIYSNGPVNVYSGVGA
ncbi:MAG: hypothetical protein RMI99_07155, partial [Nitrososphaerota archaeon]|nr:hypothetical protein [Nitrososphaerota archaeon]